MPYFFMLFVALPILEMWLLIEVGGVIGTLPTIGLVLLTAVIGGQLLRRQGLYTLGRAQQRINSGELPATEMLEGLLLAVGGALLLTPGFVTDTLGFCLLLPGLRRGVVKEMLRRGVLQMQGQTFYRSGAAPRGDSGVSGSASDAPDPRRPVTLEGEYRKEE